MNSRSDSSDLPNPPAGWTELQMWQWQIDHFHTQERNSPEQILSAVLGGGPQGAHAYSLDSQEHSRLLEAMRNAWQAKGSFYIVCRAQNAERGERSLACCAWALLDDSVRSGRM